MRYAIVSDIHANESALKRVLDDAAREGAERVVCLGDVVGYGPLPAETVRTVRRVACIALAGNHDDAVSGRLDAADFIDLAGDAVRRHRESLSKDDLDWLRRLPYTAEFDGAAAAHGDFTDPASFYYIEGEEDAKANFDACGAALMFVGHTHVPGLFLTGRSGKAHMAPPQDFTLEDGKRYVVNPGSVGYPRESNGRCLSSYVIYDSTERTVSFRFLPFAVSSVMQRGANPKRLRMWALAAMLAASAAVAGASAYLLAQKGEAPVAASAAEAGADEEDPSLVIARKSVTIGARQRCVRANLKVKKGVPVNLRISFRDANGKTLAGGWSSDVVSSDAKRHKAPPGAITADFTVSRKAADDRPTLISFSPATVEK